MADIKTAFNTALNKGDYLLENGSLSQDNGLQTAVIQSLFTDRRARNDDILPDGEEDKRGWFGNAYLLETGQLGSRLWLLKREKLTKEIVNRAKEYIEECLQWIIDENIASSLTVITEVSAPGVLGFQVQIEKPNLQSIKFKYSYVWKEESYKNVI